jgi:hypothetical protein
MTSRELYIKYSKSKLPEFGSRNWRFQKAAIFVYPNHTGEFTSILFFRFGELHGQGKTLNRR